MQNMRNQCALKKAHRHIRGVRFGRPAGEKRVYFDLAKKPTGAANLKI
jgi:hypothetical protein